MGEILEYPSRLSDPGSRKFETFSYLPGMSSAQIRAQVAYIVARGWNPAIEHAEPAHAAGAYWYMWKLPLFGETDVDRILAEAAACHAAHPDDHVRLIGYDNARQTQGAAMVIYRGKAD
ncbi:MAG: ribulose bisphosphate carboxylase small subunit [Burkholderiales bacterium]|nr:ribulose bisphosphate carboxylase small subunit [Burkholderiales bacterium]